jgi:formylglycine-generating enzyme required for sulfatase activity
MDYAEWLSQQTAKRYRLPTEAEWEYAARAGTETTYWWGNEIKPGMANWGGNQTSPVGSFPSNPFGLYDTAGNAWEWVHDCWHENYKGAPEDGSPWVKENDGNCGVSMMRGGSWADRAEGVRISARNWGKPDESFPNVGFRLAQDID